MRKDTLKASLFQDCLKMGASVSSEHIPLFPSHFLSLQLFFMVIQKWCLSLFSLSLWVQGSAHFSTICVFLPSFLRPLSLFEWLCRRSFLQDGSSQPLWEGDSQFRKEKANIPPSSYLLCSLRRKKKERTWVKWLKPERNAAFYIIIRYERAHSIQNKKTGQHVLWCWKFYILRSRTRSYIRNQLPVLFRHEWLEYFRNSNAFFCLVYF